VRFLLVGRNYKIPHRGDLIITIHQLESHNGIVQQIQSQRCQSLSQRCQLLSSPQHYPQDGPRRLTHPQVEPTISAQLDSRSGIGQQLQPQLSQHQQLQHHFHLDQLHYHSDGPKPLIPRRVVSTTSTPPLASPAGTVRPPSQSLAPRLQQPQLQCHRRHRTTAAISTISSLVVLDPSPPT